MNWSRMWFFPSTMVVGFFYFWLERKRGFWVKCFISMVFISSYPSGFISSRLVRSDLLSLSLSVQHPLTTPARTASVSIDWDSFGVGEGGLLGFGWEGLQNNCMKEMEKDRDEKRGEVKMEKERRALSLVVDSRKDSYVAGSRLPHGSLVLAGAALGRYRA